MQHRLSDDQVFFRDTTRRFLESECPTATVRELGQTGAGFDRSYWRQGAELGWTSMLVAEQFGGGTVSESGIADLTLIADAFGANVAPGPLLPTNVVAAALSSSSNARAHEGLLEGLIAGEVVAAWAFVEAPPCDTFATTTRAVADGEGFVLSGVKTTVEAGAEADVLLVTARSEAGMTQFVVPVGTPGVTVVPLDSLDLVRRYARVELEQVSVPRSAVVGAIDHAAAAVERQLQLALAIQNAESVGAAQTVFDFTLDWAFNRYSFGRPLASYQELKHRFADMKMWLEASHALADALVRDIDRDDEMAAETASVTQAYIGEHLPALVQDCVQMHGGIGVTFDHDIHLYLRRVTVNRVAYGTPSDHRRRITDLRSAA
ncbi:MAG TPA: acyl-CoA dehydrogenase family protein [Acidimicrobiia bacterium]